MSLLKIKIDSTKILDSPFEESLSEIFQFNNAELNNLVKDIKNGNPTCYLISG
jgi:hypothetical protein